MIQVKEIQLSNPNYILSNYERETIITYNEDEKTAEVFTYRKTLIKKLDALCDERDDIKCIRAERYGGCDVREYVVPKKWIKVSPPKRVEMTEEAKAAAAERLLKAREAKNNA